MSRSVRYWRLNPDQDTINPRKSPPDPVDNIVRNRTSSVGSSDRTRTNGDNMEGKRRDGRFPGQNGNAYQGRANDSPV